jgi:hypothetical protein
MSQVTEVPMEVAPPPSPTGGDKEVTPPAVETVRTKDFKLPCFSTRNEFEVGDLLTPTCLGFESSLSGRGDSQSDTGLRTCLDDA